MITYVNKVFVCNAPETGVIEGTKTLKNALDTELDKNKDKFVIEDNTENSDEFRIGMVTGVIKVHGAKDANSKYANVVKWSNWINKNFIKSAKYTKAADYTAKTKEDTVTINFTECFKKTVNEAPVEIDPNEFSQGNRRIVVRLTFKDMPTRFRKWTESYEYVTKPGDKAEQIADAFAAMITDQYKRARVDAKAAAGVLTLTALPYDDDNSVDTINVANKVRFNANVYYTNPQAAGFASKNKYFPTGLSITKVEGVDNPVSGKHVRDHEAQAMGYEGILNRGCCTWPIVKPAMTADITKDYNCITIEFENKYRAADDIQRHTKQLVEIYTVAAPGDLLTKINDKLDTALA